MVRSASLVAIGCACLASLPLVGSDARSQQQQRPDEPGIFDGVRSKRYGVFIVKEVREKVVTNEADPGRGEGRKQ